MLNLKDQLFCKIGEQSLDVYFIFNKAQHHFEYLNKAIEHLWELKEEDIKNNPEILCNAIHPEDIEHVMDCYQESQEDLQPKKYEFRLLFSQEREKYVRVSVFPLNEPEGLILAGIVEDTTVLRHNKLHIEQINAHKNITLEVLSHDLKEPLGMMQMMASSITEDIAGLGNERSSKALEFIIEMCDRNLKLVKSMINREFLKSSYVEIGKERADIVAEIKDVVRFFRRSQLHLLKQFEFSSNTEKLFINIDSMKFLQVINNLISNAIKFTEDQGIIHVGVRDQNHTVLITVSDNGIGIPDELKDQLFDRLAQTLRPGLKGKDSGGFGMSIIKTIVELHKGKIWFESEVGKGTTFYIELPNEVNRTQC